MSDVSLILNILIIVLLAATLFYCWQLYQRLQMMNSIKNDMQKLISELNQAATRAETGIYALKAATQELAVDLQRKLQTGRALADDLQFLLQRGGQSAERLEKNILDQRPKQAATAKPESAPDASPTVSSAEEELLDEDVKQLLDKLKTIR